MQAQIGDQVLVESERADRHRRSGKIVALHHPDGTPPYDVRWDDDGHVSVVFPGPDAHIRHTGPAAGG